MEGDYWSGRCGCGWWSGDLGAGKLGKCLSGVQKPIVTLGWRLKLDDRLHWGYIEGEVKEVDEMREMSREHGGYCWD